MTEDIHSCHHECQRPACVAVRDAIAAERSLMAELVEQMGIEGYGTLAIAAAIRAGHNPEPRPKTSSPAQIRRQANRPWDDKASY
jgi:hypothetical protein